MDRIGIRDRCKVPLALLPTRDAVQDHTGPVFLHMGLAMGKTHSIDAMKMSATIATPMNAQMRHIKYRAALKLADQSDENGLSASKNVPPFPPRQHIGAVSFTYEPQSSM